MTVRWQYNMARGCFRW